MDLYEIPLVVALLSLLAAVIGQALAARNQAEESRRKEARLAVAELIKNSEVAAHNISWFTWQAKYRAAHLSAEHAHGYDGSMNEIYCTLTASLALAGAHSKIAYRQFRDMVKQVYDLDDKVAQAATGLLDGNDDAASAIAAFYEEAQKLEDDIVKKGLLLMTTIG